MFLHIHVFTWGLYFFFRQSYTRHTLVEIFIIWWQCVAFYSRCKIRTRLTLIDVFESLNKRMRKKHTLIRFVLWNYPWNFNWWLLFGSSIWKFSMKLNYSTNFFLVLFNFIQLFLDDKLFFFIVESSNHLNVELQI